MAEPDDLYTLRQEFYVGNFQVRPTHLPTHPPTPPLQALRSSIPSHSPTHPPTHPIQAAINEGGALGRVSPDLETERAEFVYRYVRESLLSPSHSPTHPLPPPF